MTSPLVVVYAGHAPDPVPSRLMADHLRHAVPLAGGRFGMQSSVPSSQPAPAAPPVSPGECSGPVSGARSGAAHDILRQFRDETPARWQSFLQGHFASGLEVSLFFNVDEKTGRNWWNGVGRPALDKALYAELSFPDGYRAHMLPAPSPWAAE